MGFIIGDKKIGFKDYKKLYESAAPYLSEIADRCAEWFDEKSDNIILTTSGTSAIPKTISLPKSSMVTSAKMTQSYFGYGGGDTALLGLPVKFIGGTMMLIRAITTGLDLVLVPPASRILRGLTGPIDFVPMTPHQLMTAVRQDSDKLQYVGQILLGGAPVSRELQDIIPGLRPKIFIGFGMTETITHIAVRPLNGLKAKPYFEVLKGIGVSTDDKGCLVIDADHLADTVFTKDIVDIIDERQFHWIGRYDNVINTGGIKVYPEIIEEKISQLLDVDFFVAGMPHEDFGKQVCIFIEGKEESLTGNIINGVKEALNKYEMPRCVYYLDVLQRTPTGKVKRKKILSDIVANNIKGIKLDY